MADSKLPNHGTRWSEEEEQRLSKLYPDHDTTELVTEFGRTAEAIKARAKKLGVKKSEAYRAENRGVRKEVVQRGLKTEERFERYADERGWTWYRNSLFNNYHSNKEEYEQQIEWYEQLLEPPQEEWVSTMGIQEDLIELRGLLEQLTDLPSWFVDLRTQVDQALADWDYNWTGYPDYVVGDSESSPRFVEVKYGTSNLSRAQYDFCSHLLKSGIPIYLFRVSPGDREELVEWEGTWK